MVVNERHAQQHPAAARRRHEHHSARLYSPQHVDGGEQPGRRHEIVQRALADLHVGILSATQSKHANAQAAGAGMKWRRVATWRLGATAEDQASRERPWKPKRRMPWLHCWSPQNSSTKSSEGGARPGAVQLLRAKRRRASNWAASLTKQSGGYQRGAAGSQELTPVGAATSWACTGRGGSCGREPKEPRTSCDGPCLRRRCSMQSPAP